jgi:hypothetical protein
MDAICICFLKASILCFSWVHVSILLHTNTTSSEIKRVSKI